MRDVDYLFLQVSVDQAAVSDSQNCGNILAGVGPWAIENGLVALGGAVTPVRIHMVNTASVCGGACTDSTADASNTKGTRASTVCPGTAAGISIDFLDVAGSILRRAVPHRATWSIVWTVSRSPASTTACRW